MTTELVLAMLLMLPPAYVDRDEEGRQERMGVIADAVSQATERASCSGEYASEKKCVAIWHGEPKQLAALLVTKGWHESRFAKNVHEGRCKKDECDPKMWRGVLVHAARSPWQFQRTSYASDLWKHTKGAGLGATRNAAFVAARILSEGKKRCRSNYGALAFYGIQQCQWKGARRRYSTFVKLMEM